MDAIRCPQRDYQQAPRSVFIFFTTLYRPDMLNVGGRIKHKWRIRRQLGKVFS
jgi:hypothetical protein